jgi:hypothetical protein
MPGLPGYSRENLFKADVTKLYCKGVDWIEEAQDMILWRAFLKAEISLQVSK